MDDCIEMRLNINDLKILPSERIQNLTEEYYDDFFNFHDRHHNPKMYWTSERIVKKIDLWQIHIVIIERRIEGYVLSNIKMRDPNQAEIFCVETNDLICSRELFSISSKESFERGKTEILYMSDKNTIHKTAALETGFKVTGFYQGFEVLL